MVRTVPLLLLSFRNALLRIPCSPEEKQNGVSECECEVLQGAQQATTLQQNAHTESNDS